jgi:hypothetical protein
MASLPFCRSKPGLSLHRLETRTQGRAGRTVHRLLPKSSSLGRTVLRTGVWPGHPVLSATPADGTGAGRKWAEPAAERAAAGWWAGPLGVLALLAHALETAGQWLRPRGR